MVSLVVQDRKRFPKPLRLRFAGRKQSSFAWKWLNSGHNGNTSVLLRNLLGLSSMCETQRYTHMGYFEISKKDPFSSLRSAWGRDIRQIFAPFNLDCQFLARAGQRKETRYEEMRSFGPVGSLSVREDTGAVKMQTMQQYGGYNI